MVPVLASMILAAAPFIEGMSPVEIESAYWDCEFTATQGAISLDQAAACGEIYEQLKTSKFLGDFDRFLSWWRENKHREFSSRMELRQFRRSQ